MIETSLATQLITRISGIPLMISPERLTVLLNVIENLTDFESMDNRIFSAAIAGRKQPASPSGEGTIAIIPVYDVLFYRRRGLLGLLFGSSSSEEIRASFNTALNSPDVKAIVFDIDSPGGEVSGVNDLVDEIYQARGRKPIYAVANELAYSAAYEIASAADRIYLPRTGGVGSIGVVALHVDQSSRDAQLGLKYTYIYAGAHKAEYSSHAPLSAEAFQAAKKEVDEVYEIFVETVSRNRKLDPKVVRDTEAGLFQGRRALEAGLADKILPWDQAIREIISEQGGRPMDSKEIKTRFETLLTNESENAQEVLAELGYVPAPAENPQDTEINVEEITNQAAEAGRNEALARVTGIIDLCSLAGMPQMASSLIKENVSVEDARKKILAAKAEMSGKDEIVSTVGPLNTGELNPMVADAQRRAEAAKNRR